MNKDKVAFGQFEGNRLVVRDYLGKVIFSTGSVIAAYRWCEKNGLVLRCS